MNKYKVNPVTVAPRYFWVIVYRLKAIIPGDIAANKVHLKKSGLNVVDTKFISS